MTIEVVLAGCGNMGHAMLAGWLAAGRLTPPEVFVVEPSDALRERARGLGVAVGVQAPDVPDTAPRLVVLAVKPQIIREVAEGYRRFAGGQTTFLSIAAGTRMAVFEAVLGSETPIVRCMPNTPASIGRGMMAIIDNGRVEPATLGFTRDLLSANGEVVDLDREDQMDAVTAVSGSGPAYVFHFIECLAAAAEQAGLPSGIARRLAMQTVYGASSLAAQSEDGPAELRRQVTSPNGTTAAALEVLMGGDRLKILLGDAVEAARNRSVELG